MRVSQLQSAVLALSLMAAAGVAVTITSPTAHSQSNISGDISGTVTDASGAALPNAKITITSEARGEVKTVTSDSVGNFRVPLLSPGSYKLSVTADGFNTSTLTTTV